MNEYTFPLSACEAPNKKGIAQPYSVIVNFINCCVIFYFLLKVKHVYSFILLFSILCFQLVHLISHMFHLKGSIQTNIIHAVTYCINISLLYACYGYTHIFPHYAFLLFLCVFVFFDLYSLFNLNMFFYVLSQSLIFISILFYYYPLLPAFIQKSVFPIMCIIGVTLLFEINEIFNCKRMMSFYPLPYHIIIELLGILLFYTICSNFYKL